MDRILLVVAITLLYSAPSLAAGEERFRDGFRYTLVSYHENGFDGAKPIVRMGGYGQLADETMTFEGSLSDDWQHRGGILGTSVGVGVVPLFDTYGVFRTKSNQNKPTYVALGYISDELAIEDSATSGSRDDRGFSLGFGVNDASFNFEYMMLVNDDNYEVSAIGVGFISEF